MRRKYSIRTLFIIVALAAAALYVVIVRPTSLARRFVAAVTRQDYDDAAAMFRNGSGWIGIVRPRDSVKPDRIYAELLPREWRDVWNCRRRILFRVMRHSDESGGYVDWTEDSEFVAHPLGLDLIAPDAFLWRRTGDLPSQPAIINPGEGGSG